MAELVVKSPTVENLIQASRFAPLTYLCDQTTEDRTMLPYLLFRDPEQRAAFLELVSQQPAADQAKIVKDLSAPKDAPFADVLALIKLTPSVSAQAEVLQDWALESPERGQGSPAWLKELPSQRLRQEMERRMKTWSWDH